MATITKSIKGTQTEKNLVNSYINESQSYARYTFYGKIATKEKYYPVAYIFNLTAMNELHHAKVFGGFLQGGVVEATVPVDAGIAGTTAENLKVSIGEEEHEGVEAYLAYAKTAREEGFDVIASHFEAIAKVEQTHEERFRRFLSQVENGTVWKRDTPITWKCLVCGYEVVGTEPPAVCPGCDHPKEHYMAMDNPADLI